VAEDPIKHVVVLALEHRSFDHALGACHASAHGLMQVHLLASLRSSEPQL